MEQRLEQYYGSDRAYHEARRTPGEWVPVYVVGWKELFLWLIGKLRPSLAVIYDPQDGGFYFLPARKVFR